MRRVNLCWWSLIICSILLSSCAKEKQTMNHDTYAESKMLSELKTLNDSIRVNYPETKSARGWFVAASDVIGIHNGSSDGGTLGFWVGTVFGNPLAGKVIGTMVGGLLYGAAYSYIAYDRTSGNIMNVDDLYNLTVNSMIATQQLDILLSNKYQIIAEDNNSLPANEDDELASAVDVPANFSDAEFVADGHNLILGDMLYNDSQPISSVEISEEERSLALDILLSEDLKNKFKEDFSKIFNSGISYETLRDTKSAAAINLFLEVFELTADDLESVTEISNEYINIIEQAEELSDDEKMSVYSSLAVATYSTDFWINHFQTLEE